MDQISAEFYYCQSIYNLKCKMHNRRISVVHFKLFDNQLLLFKFSFFPAETVNLRLNFIGVSDNDDCLRSIFKKSGGNAFGV